MAKIMIQGTGSSVGKSIIVAALCRIFKQDGYSVCPYKSQNMSLNSYITMDGKEMGRAQVLQAYAAGIEPQVFMNPILLKPTGDTRCQVIVNGKVYDNHSAEEYHNLKILFKDMLKEQFLELEKDFDIIVMEGAGSPAEINLRDRDIVNMGMAELVDAPVLIVGDIDKGGVFASLAGTMLLLTEEERERVKGTIINKFRGDIKLLTPGLDMLEEIIKRPCLGVAPYFKLVLEDEDGAMMEINKKVTGPIDVAVIMLPHVSNFTDVDCLKTEEDVSVRFVSSIEEFGRPDLLVIPGSKNTIEDLNTIRNSGFEEKILDYSRTGRILGICGGYQMLGQIILDPLI
ncbi:MAG: cobalamin biosynthesis protein CobQ [Clostridiales bacterium]|nr:cobalamin biosynthesis protein CobQ [Clostridiales bacterium]